MPDAQFTLGQPISHRIDHMLSGQRTALSFRVIGEDRGELMRQEERVREAIEGVPSLVDLSAEQIVGVPQVVFDTDFAAAARNCLPPSVGAEAADTALRGITDGCVNCG